MKLICFLCLIVFIPAFREKSNYKVSPPPVADSTRNIFIITIDGFRQQELFNGPDDGIVADKNFTADSETIRLMYGAASAEESRKKLLPFLWSVAAAKGQVYGNSKYKNEVTTANLYNISYAGYNEMFTGTTDLTAFNNNKKYNRNKNIFEYIGALAKYKNKIALFTSWDVFPYILNEKRSEIEVNSGYEPVREESENQKLLNTVQSDLVTVKEHTRHDMLTGIAAKEYLQLHHPKIFFLGLGETDEYAHRGNYDMYLQKANEADQIIQQLWQWTQQTEGYKNNTTFIVTTDHGRGSAASLWTRHGTFVKGSSSAWLILFGKGVKPEGEIKTAGKIYQKQIAQTIAGMLGEHFGSEQPVDFATN